MCSQFDSETPEWEPESLPLVIELDSPPPRPSHEDAQDSDKSSRVIVIDLV
jgi:hypothetical protein